MGRGPRCLGRASAVRRRLGSSAQRRADRSGLRRLPGRRGVRLPARVRGGGLRPHLLAGRYSVGPPSPPRDRWAWAGSALLLLGAALCDTPLAALPLIAAGTAAAALYADRRRMGEGLAVAAVALLAVLAAAGIWETAYRLALRRWSETVLLNKVTPPSRGEMEALGKEIQGHFARIDLAALVPRAPAGLERQDLAYALWRSSPLARPYSLSALVVMPLEGEPSFFSFGMPLTQGKVDWSPERWRGLGLPLWEESPVSGEIGLKLAGKPWGKARFWLMPRPGFELRDRRRLGEAEVGLLKGGPAADPVQELLEPAVYALYTQSGSPSLSPWDETPRLAERLRPSGGRGSAIVDTPVGRARAYSHMTLGVWEVIYLPFLPPLSAVERTSNSVLGVLLILTLAAPPVLLLSLPRASFRALLGRVLRSYSKRLMIVYTLLLLVPLLLALRRPGALHGGAAEPRSSGRRARRRSARRSGSSASVCCSSSPASASTPRSATAARLALRVVQHEVNLYWGSEVYASSKHELFTAGLLPRRIPGEIYARLAFCGDGLLGAHEPDRRRALPRALRAAAPAGSPPGAEPPLPLHAAARAAGGGGDRAGQPAPPRACLVTVALFLLSVAVGTRLARNFTRPLTSWSRARAIAAGAPSLELRPAELELAAPWSRRWTDGATHRRRPRTSRAGEAGGRADRRERHLRRGVARPRSAGCCCTTAWPRAARRRARRGARPGGGGRREARAGRRLLAPGRRAAGGDGARDRPARRPGSGEREWRLVWVPLPAPASPRRCWWWRTRPRCCAASGSLAWAEMARIIAHEIKNPLTPIRLSTEHLREVWHARPRALRPRCSSAARSTSCSQVEELRHDRLGVLHLQPPSCGSIAAAGRPRPGHRGAGRGLPRPRRPKGCSVELETDGRRFRPASTPSSSAGAVRNLIENALRASGGSGRVTVERGAAATDRRGSRWPDQGPGVPPEKLPRIFEPYFSTHAGGTGLGLPIARRIAEEHGGTLARPQPERAGAGGGDYSSYRRLTLSVRRLPPRETRGLSST